MDRQKKVGEGSSGEWRWKQGGESNPEGAERLCGRVSNRNLIQVGRAGCGRRREVGKAIVDSFKAMTF